MIFDPLINVPLLSRKWLPVGYACFPLPILILILSMYMNMDVGDYLLDMFYCCWAAGFLILNLIREKIEDEMVKNFRLQAYQSGFYSLLSGLAFLMTYNFIRSFFGEFTALPISAALVLWLLNTYIFFAFQYQKYNAAKGF